MKGREEGKFLAVVNEIAMLLLHCTINTFYLYLLFFKKVRSVLGINYPTCIENFNISFFQNFQLP